MSQEAAWLKKRWNRDQCPSPDTATGDHDFRSRSGDAEKYHLARDDHHECLVGRGREKCGAKFCSRVRKESVISMV